MTRSSAPILTVVAISALVAGCGGGGSGSSASSGGGGGYGGGGAAKTPTAAAAAPAAGALALKADESGGLAFTPKALSGKAGTVTLKLDNPGGNALPHAIAIEGPGVAKNGAVVQPGGTSSVTVALKPGKYTFFCPVGSHRANGMEGQLTVS